MNIKITIKKEGKIFGKEVKRYRDIWKLRDDNIDSVTLIKRNYECTYIKRKNITKIEVEA